MISLPQSEIKLSIITMSLNERRELREPLFEELYRQMDGKPVEHTVVEDNGHTPNGIKMIIGEDTSHGEYVCTVDDDDWIAPNYIDSILEALEQNPDVVTFRLKHPTYGHVWKFQKHPKVTNHSRLDKNRMRLMIPNQLCVWRRSMLLEVPWLPGVYGVDQLRAELLNTVYPDATEVHIPEELYTYVYNQDVTRTQGSYAHDWYNLYRGGVDAWRHKASGVLSMGMCGRDVMKNAMVIDRTGGVSLITNKDDYEHLGTFHIK